MSIHGVLGKRNWLWISTKQIRIFFLYFTKTNFVLPHALDDKVSIAYKTGRIRFASWSGRPHPHPEILGSLFPASCLPRAGLAVAETKRSYYCHWWDIKILCRSRKEKLYLTIKVKRNVSNSVAWVAEERITFHQQLKRLFRGGRESRKLMTFGIISVLPF